jgi:hypothetical protein
VLEGKMIEPFRVQTDAAGWRISPADAARLLGSRCGRPRLAYRDVASATNRVTLIAAILPAHTVSTHTLFCLKDPAPAPSQRVLCALFNSLILNFLVRLRVTTHVTTAIVQRLPVPTEEQLGPMADQVGAAAATLARSYNAATFVDLNALVARAYQLSAAEFRHVLDTFPLVNADERAAMLDRFSNL